MNSSRLATSSQYNFVATDVRKSFNLYILTATLQASLVKSESVSHSVMSNSWDPMDCNTPGSFVHGVLQVILQWVNISFSRGSSQPKNQTQVFCIAGGFFTIRTTRLIGLGVWFSLRVWEVLSSYPGWAWPLRASLVAQWWRILLPSRKCGFDPWIRKIPWRRKWQPTPVFLPGKSHGPRSLAGYGVAKEADMT